MTQSLLLIGLLALLVGFATALANVFLGGAGDLTRYVAGTLLWSLPVAFLLILFDLGWVVLIGAVFLSVSAFVTVLMRALDPAGHRVRRAVEIYHGEKS